MAPSKVSLAVPVSEVNQLVIVAGGKGARLAHLFEDQPKALIPIGGKPVIQHQLELAARTGIKHVEVFAGHHGEKITDFVGNGSRFGLHARVKVESEPLGNAGGLLQSLDALASHFFVLYGDLMLDVDLRRMARHHIDQKADFTVLVHPNDHPHDSDLVEIDSNHWVTTIHTPPHAPDRFYNNLVNAALYVASREALMPWAKSHGKQDFTLNILPGLIASGARVLAYRSHEFIKDMGTPSRLRSVEADWENERSDLTGSTQRSSAIFLDRDGTLNVERGFLRDPKDLELLSNVGPVLRSLRKAGFRLVVLTNQPVIARGEATEADVAAIHTRLEWELGKQGAYLDGIYVCPHHPDRGFPGERTDLKFGCKCRKPATGLLERACRDLQIDSAGSWMVGDQTVDIEMARRAGLRSILVKTGVAGRDGRFQSAPDHVADDLTAAADLILQCQKIEAL